jgi:hypothetical protein
VQQHLHVQTTHSKNSNGKGTTPFKLFMHIYFRSLHLLSFRLPKVSTNVKPACDLTGITFQLQYDCSRVPLQSRPPHELIHRPLGSPHISNLAPAFTSNQFRSLAPSYVSSTFQMPQHQPPVRPLAPAAASDSSRDSSFNGRNQSDPSLPQSGSGSSKRNASIACLNCKSAKRKASTMPFHFVS